MSDSMKTSFVHAAEEETGRRITIESECSHTHLEKCHLQEQSPLFSLPQEIRDLVWRYALHEELEPDVEFSDNPDLRGGRLRSYTDLLLTSRRVWLEANALSFPEAKHQSWLTGGKKYNEDLVEKLTVLNQSRIKCLHVILEGCWLGFSRDYAREELPMWPEKLIITIMSWPWYMIPGTREIGKHIDIFIRDILLDDTVGNTQEVEFHLEERVEPLRSAMPRTQPGITRLHYVQQRNLDNNSGGELNDVDKYWELLPVNQEPCRYWTRIIPKSYRNAHEGADKVDYLTYKFTFRRKAPFAEDYRSAANAGHTSRGDPPPDFNVELSDRVEHVSRPTTPIEDNEHSMLWWETRWADENSLLKFAS